jgi:acetyl-CoA C-acetyltransferase
LAEAFVAVAVRVPVGRKDGALSTWHPADLLAVALREVVRRAGINPEVIDDVIVGCVSQSGAQSFNIARTALLSAGFPESVPGTTVDRQCGSSQQAAHFAAQGVMAGSYDVAIAAGVEVMSMVPILSNWYDGVAAGHGDPLQGRSWQDRYAAVEISQFNGAELIAEKYEISRSEMETFAVNSHQRAVAAWDAGRFADEVVAVSGLEIDEGFRRDSTRERLAGLKVLRQGGRITAATSSQISDGAAALLIVSGDALKRYGLTPMARFAGFTVVGADPVTMLEGPIPATKKLLDRAGLNIDDIGLFEVNEAFASVVLAWTKATGAGLEKTNVNGGAIALGHPLGASGARLMTTLVHEMKRRRTRFGVQTMCEGGGLANATLLELVD